MSEPSCGNVGSVCFGAPQNTEGAAADRCGTARPEASVSARCSAGGEKQRQEQLRFGTDGIRGIAGRELTARTAFALGCALCRLYPSPRVVVGQDTRTSSDMLAHALAAGVAAGGGQALLGGVLPSAAVSFFVLKERAACGVVVSASHNPPAYNGLKVFGGDGAKLPEGDERRLERMMLSPVCAPPLSMGGVRRLRGKGAYLARLASLAPCALAGKTFVIDCANGAARLFAPRLFRRLGARVFAVGCGAGKNINCACGALHPQRLCAEVRRREADAGFAYDGDADRLIACDERGEVIDGDGILYALACAAKAEGKLPRGLVVGTAYTNAGAERALAARGIRLLRAPVGDKFVAARMRESGAALGGEQSGHILPACSPAGDGILASLFLAALLRRGSLSALCALPRLAQVHIGVRLPPSACGAIARCTYGTEEKDGERAAPSSFSNKNREEGEGAAEEPSQTKTAETFADIEAKTGARLVVRPSGTEPVVRVFAEAEGEAAARLAAEEAARAVLQSLQ